VLAVFKLNILYKFTIQI